MQTDRIFSQQAVGAGEFSFDENVANVFDDMINRSVPLYADVQRVIPLLIGGLQQDPVRIVDLGCSTGTSLIHLAQALPNRNLDLIGVDNSQPMLEKFNEKLEALNLQGSSNVVCADIQSFEFTDASVVLMNYTLQFIQPKDRLTMLQRIRQRLQPGGFLLLSEKVSHAQEGMDKLLTEQYFDFKRRNGYSELEIARKRDALENVLVPLTVDQNIELLTQAGFEKVEVLLKWFNFTTLMATL